MLHSKPLPPGTLDTLMALCAHSAITPFALTGGTALALRFGHRLSVDLDFFTPDSFDSAALATELGKAFQLTDVSPGSSGLNLMIDEVKVDFVTYRYELLDPYETIENVRLFGLRDNIAMKLSALTNRGAKKDFFDVHELIKQFGLRELLDIYQAKYPNHDVGNVLRRLVYFEDAEIQSDPLSLDGTEWEEVQKAVSAAVAELL